MLYTAFIGGSIAGLGDIYSQLQRSVGASERILEILDQPDERSASNQSYKFKGHIEFDQVSFTYPTRLDIEVLKKTLKDKCIISSTFLSAKRVMSKMFSKEEYEDLLAKMPNSIRWEDLSFYETEDGTSGTQTLACTSDGNCEIVDISA